MRDQIRRIPALLLASLILVCPLSSIPHAAAQTVLGDREVLLATLDDAALQDLLATSGFLSLAQQGGAALLVMTEPGDAFHDFPDVFSSSSRGPLPDAFVKVDLGSMADEAGVASPAKLGAAAEQLASVLDRSTATSELVLLASNSPPGASEAAGDHLGAMVMAEGSPKDLAAAIRAEASDASVRTLTSDSTRREGVVASPDLAQTAFASGGLLAHDLGGEPIRVVDAPPPIDLHERYIQSKRLTVPIGTAAAFYAGLASLIAIIALSRPSASRRVRAFCASLAISVPFLALSLLLVGHLPSLTYGTVIPFLIATTALVTITLAVAARRWGTFGAIVAAGSILLGALVVEAGLGWTAALTPLLGGSQLDGGRFFGLPNAFVGLLLGGSLYVAQRLPRVHGTALIAVAGLFAGSPWTGSNIGAAVTLFAAAGIWLGLRGELSWWRTAIAAVAAIATGTVIVVVAHRFLTSATTHITTFSEHTGGIQGLWDRLVDRLGVGADLIADNPFALLPVIGVAVMLVVVLRPPGPIRPSFDGAPVWRVALLTIVAASVVAYLVNDSGAAAVGEGLTTSLAGMLYVSLRWRDGMMMGL
ncbi:MAG: hypothetical protein ABI595_04425 [Actinomycetota bacterium]